MRQEPVVFRCDLWTYTNAEKAEEIRLATVVRRAGGLEDLGSGIGESNATAAGGFEDLGSGIGESNATVAGGFEDLGSGIGESKDTSAGGFEDLGSGIGESRAIKSGGWSGLPVVPAEKISVRSAVEEPKCNLSFKEEAAAGANGATEASGPKVANESIITQMFLLISY